MAELDGVLVLDTDESESKIEALGDLFDRITTGFSVSLAEALDQLTTVPEPTLETTGLTESVAQAVAEGGTEGAAGVSAAIDALVVEPVVIPVDADTSEAEAALADLGASAESATVGIGGLGGATKGLDAASGLATGSAAGLGSAVEGLGGKVALGVGAFTAGAAVVATFFNEAVDALGATQRFEGTLGNLADQVENLQNIEGLNTNLSDLALSLGSDDDKVRQVVARLFELATASGVARDRSSLFVQQMVALGARAVALNPQLGDVGDVTDALTTALVRGGRFAAKFGLDLNAAEINARALKETNKESVEELSFVEKAAAGASLAFEKYGANLENVVARGAENAITQQRRLKQEIVETFEALGAPLVTPIFDILDEAQPIVESIGRIFASLAQAALPGIEAALEAVEPPLRIFANIIEFLSPLLPFIVTTLIALKAASLGVAAANALMAISTAAAATATEGLSIAAVASGAALGPAALAAAAFGASFLVTTEILERTHGLFGLLGDDANDLTDEVESLESAVDALAGVADDRLVPTFRALVQAEKDLLREQGNATLATIRQGAVFSSFRDVAKDNLGVAIRLAEQYRGNATVYARFQQILAEVAGTQRQSNADSAAATRLVNAQAQAVDDLAGSMAAVPSAGDTFDSFASDVAAAFDGATPSIEAFVDNLTTTASEVRTWLDTVKFLSGEGLDGLAQLLLDRGPEAVDPFVAELQRVGPESATAWDAALRAATIGLGNMKSEADTLGQDVAENVLTPIKALPPKVAGALGQVVSEIDAAKGGAAAGGYGLGVGVADGVAQGIESRTDFIARVLQGTIQNAKDLAEGYAGISSPSKLFADDVGAPIAQGIALGIEREANKVSLATNAAISGALTALAVPGAFGGAAAGFGGAFGGSSSTVNNVIDVGGVTNIGPDLDSRGNNLIRKMRDAQHLAGV